MSAFQDTPPRLIIFTFWNLSAIPPGTANSSKYKKEYSQHLRAWFHLFFNTKQVWPAQYLSGRLPENRKNSTGMGRSCEAAEISCQCKSCNISANLNLGCLKNSTASSVTDLYWHWSNVWLEMLPSKKDLKLRFCSSFLKFRLLTMATFHLKAMNYILFPIVLNVKIILHTSYWSTSSLPCCTSDKAVFSEESYRHS